MCGIVGAISFKDSDFRITESYITRMRDVMVHRGPDGAGIWIGPDGRVGFGHRRLSIIDLSDSAAQPMCNEDGTLWISFNGEIYNHAEIREELERLGGHQWKTDHSDTEVILHAFEQWGIECLQKFRGMFAIALFDAKARELWLIRDRIGIKPLYYSIHHGRLTFASEIKALLQDPGQHRVVHEEAFYHYLSFLTTPPPQTLFDGIKKLAGGTWMRISEEGQIREHRYWDVWEYSISLENVSEDEIAERILIELKTAVKLRKVSDVPVGVFLSGGIDSSTNLALFSEDGGEVVKSFSIGYDRDYHTYKNELYYARKVADMFGSEHYVRLLNVDDLLEFLPRMVYLQDEPIADPVCVPIYYVSKLARDNGVIVAQVGEGADELFWGYPSWKQCLNLQKVSDLFPWGMPKRMVVSLLGINSKLHNSIRLEWLHRAGIGKPIFWSGVEAFSELQKRRLLHRRLRSKFINYSSWEAINPVYQRFREKAWEKSHLNWMSYADLNLRLPELLLMRVDKMSMGVSLEARTPFLDHKFVELAMSIPEAIKTKDNTLKYILKKTARGVIPDEIIDRRKQGFSVPLSEWLLGKLGDVIARDVDRFCKDTEFFDRDEMAHIFSQKNGMKIWFIYNFILWMKEYIF